MKVFLPLSVAVLAVATVNGALLESTYTGTKGLHELATAQGKYMGTATDNGELTDKYYLAALQNITEFGMITPANAMKWDATEATQNTFTYTNGDAIVSIADEMGAQVRCHTLLWHKQVPDWVHSLSKTEMLSALENHITKVMTHFGDSCYAWDVANEVMDDNAQMRDSFWYKTTGMDFMSTAFNTAAKVKKQLGLKTKLYYNDYNTNTVNAKSTAVLDMIKKLMDQGVPIEGVGFQSHSSYSDTSTTEDLVTNLERFTALGLDVAYTELDVKTSSTLPSEEEQEQQVTVYTNTVAACQQVENCVGVTIWDFDDTYTWIDNAAPLPWYQPNGKDTALVRKRAYDAIVAGWGTVSTASSDTSSTSGTESSAAGTTTGSTSVAADAETSMAASGATETTSSVDEETSATASNATEAASSTGTETSTGASSATETTSTASSTTGTEPTSTASSEATNDTAAPATESSSSAAETAPSTASSGNTATSTTESGSNAETSSNAGSSAQKAHTGNTGACTRLRK